MKFVPAVLALVAVSLTPAVAHAQPFDDEWLTIRVSGFHADSRIALAADGRARTSDFPLSIAWGAREEIEDRSTHPHLQARIRLTERQRLLGGYYQVDQSRRYSFARTFDAGDLPRELIGEIPPERADDQLNLFGDAGFEIEFELVNLMYEYTVLHTEQWSLGLSAGIHWARLEAWGDAAVSATYEDDRLDGAVDYNWSRQRWAPSLGARVVYAPAAAWRLSGEAQGFATDWGNFTTEDGHYERFSLNAEYRLTQNIGVHAGYDWFRLKIADGVRGSFVGGEITYSGRARGELRVHGPTLGLTFLF